MPTNAILENILPSQTNLIIKEIGIELHPPWMTRLALRQDCIVCFGNVDIMENDSPRSFSTHELSTEFSNCSWLNHR